MNRKEFSKKQIKVNGFALDGFYYITANDCQILDEECYTRIELSSVTITSKENIFILLELVMF